MLLVFLNVVACVVVVVAQLSEQPLITGMNRGRGMQDEVLFWTRVDREEH